MKAFVAILICLFSYTFSGAQGRVVVNEFMPWPSCATTSEFIELLNFGPGPMNIGCYVVTNGQYAVTIPPNTILQPGQYYILSGQNTLSAGCGNVDSAVTVNLNWTTCNCTDRPIPTTGDGFMTDGGSANEKIILLDPALNVVDAVSRNSPASSSVALTTAGMAGACSSKSFDLDTMAVNYEIMGNSTGKNNSFSRKVDGDCGWVKTPQVSAGAPNKTGSTSSATYSFTTLTASECQTTEGSIAITVSSADVNALFPMNYVLAYDADSNGVFTGVDSYLYGADSSAPNININHLKYGRYRITVGSALGCNLKSFDFFIFNCYGVVLPVSLVSFEMKDSKELRWSFLHADNLQSVDVEGSYDGISFRTIQNISPTPDASNGWSGSHTLTNAAFVAYRLKIYTIANTYFYSQVISHSSQPLNTGSIWPNPASTQINATFQVATAGLVAYSIYDAKGKIALRGTQPVASGMNSINIPIASLPTGFYHLSIMAAGGKSPILRETFIRK